MQPEKTSPLHFAAGMGTYLMWGLFPLYFALLHPAGALEVIVHRAFWGMIACLVVLIITKNMSQVWALIKDVRTSLYLMLAGLLIVANWVTYVFAVMNDHTVDAALGYFINPLVTVALAILVLRERISFAQAIALVLGVAAVIVLLVGMGRLPWISLTLAISFASYSLLKKKVASRVQAVPGMVMETLTLVPFLAAYFFYLVWKKEDSFHIIATHPDLAPPGGWIAHLLLLIGAGIVTVIPLILFAFAAKGVPLGTIGLMQYITPVMQMIIGVLIFHEHMSNIRWAGAAIIWVALIFLTADSLHKITKARRIARKAEK